MQDILKSFDQEAAACLIARLAVEKAQNETNENTSDAIKWIDRMLIRVVCIFYFIFFFFFF
jgi:protein transport protein SEC23